jgi:putative FmdB family regulatory protein
MPYYSYICPNCQIVSSLLRKMDERDEPVLCVACGEEMVRKFEAPPVHFKGSGFYVNDYKNKRKW